MHEATNNQVAMGSATVEDFPELNEVGGSERELMDAPELATKLRMTPAWVYAQTRANKIPHIPLGRYVRYRRTTIEAWLGDIENGRIPAPW